MCVRSRRSGAFVLDRSSAIVVVVLVAVVVAAVGVVGWGVGIHARTAFLPCYLLASATIKTTLLSSSDDLAYIHNIYVYIHFF